MGSFSNGRKAGRGSREALAGITALGLALGTGMARAEDGPPPEDDPALVLGAVTITARRMNEDQQDSPSSATVIQGRDLGLGRVDSLEDAAFQSPNTVYNDQGGPLTIRGIGSLGLNGGVDRQAAVGIFLDDVYIARPFGYPASPRDTERVEVVRGSQSTLYGKNTIGGAVNLVTRDPGDVFGAELESSLAMGAGPDTARGRISAAVDLPLPDPSGENDLAARAYLSWDRSAGFIENSDGDTVADTNSLATKLTLLGHLGDRTRLRLTADFSRDRDDGGLWYAPVNQALDLKADHDYPNRNELSIGGATARLDHDFGPVALTSITAVRGHEMEMDLDGDFTSAPGFPLAQAQTESQRQISQDLRLSGTLGSLGLRGGLFYMHEWFEGDQFYDMAALPRSLWSATTFDQESDTVSVFAEGTYAITPTLDVIGGLRYSFDHKTATSETSSPSGTGFMGASGRVSARESYHGLSPELTLRYRPTESVLTFAKVGRGYKSGGISPFIDAGNTPNRYDPETTTSVEVGAKTSWFDDRLRVNGSLFYTDWREQQAVIQLTPTTRVIRNAASATSKGAELEASLLLMEGLTLGANYGFLHARYDEFTDSVLGRDYSGNALPYAPEHSAGLNLDWTHPLVDDLDLKGGLSYAYRSSYAFSPDNAYRQTPTHIVDARIGVEGNGWSVDLWAKNLSDERYLTQYFDFGGVDTGVAAEGRVLGLTVAAQW